MLVGFSLTNDPFWVPHSWNKSYNHRKSINKSSLRLQLKHTKKKHHHHHPFFSDRKSHMKKIPEENHPKILRHFPEDSPLASSPERRWIMGITASKGRSWDQATSSTSSPWTWSSYAHDGSENVCRILVVCHLPTKHPSFRMGLPIVMAQWWSDYPGGWWWLMVN